MGRSNYINKQLSSKKILLALEKHRTEIKKLKVKRLGLFGSFSKGLAHSKSDLDFLVRFEEPTFDNYMELKFLLEKLFKKKIDLVTDDNIKPALIHIKKEAHYVKGL